MDRFGRHRLEHAQRASHVVPVITDRLTHRLADIEKCCEVHHRRHAVASERRAHGTDVRDVALDELAVLHGAAVSGDEIVEDDDRVAGTTERLGRVAADVAGAARHQDATPGGQWKNT